MRLFPLLLLGFAVVTAAACTEASSPDEQCINNGGICFTTMDVPYGCPANQQISSPCSTGFTCCAMAYAGNINEKTGMIDGTDAGIPSLVDAGADAGKDGEGTDAAKRDAEADSSTPADATEKDAAERDAGEKDAAERDSSVKDAAAKDAAAPVKDAGTTAKDAGDDASSTKDAASAG